MALPPGSVTRECACRRMVFDAFLSGVVTAMEEEPHPDGIYKIREGVDKPIAIRLTITQQFGRQGNLYRVHKCIKKGRAHRW
jgi:hypothetical protein